MELKNLARQLVQPGKGILAADESTGTITKRLQSVQTESTEASRRDYRETLFSTGGLGDFISGVILYDETLRQKTRDGELMVDLLRRQGIVPGIKVDKGAKPLANFSGEKITEGLDGLRQRFEEYHQLGARFSKWRAVILITETHPTNTCLQSNAEALARFAALSQEGGLIPIVEPEVIMDGPHTIGRCEAVTAAALEAVFSALARHNVDLEGMLLKPNMVISGTECPEQAPPRQVAETTLKVLKAHVPDAIPGIVILSGGQSDELATLHLDLMNRLNQAPWELSFSYGRALQAPALNTWAGKDENVAAAQAALLKRARLNGAARFGKYEETMEK